MIKKTSEALSYNIKDIFHTIIVGIFGILLYYAGHITELNSLLNSLGVSDTIIGAIDVFLGYIFKSYLQSNPK